MLEQLVVTRHGTEEEFELYVRGRLPQAEVIELEEHLLTCPACLGQMEEAAQFAGAMREALREDLKTKPTTTSMRFPILGSVFRSGFAMAAMAVVLIAVIAGTIVYVRSDARLAPMATLELTALRGGIPEVAAAREFDLKLADAPAGAFRVQVVDAVGRSEWDGNATNGGAGSEIHVRKSLAAGEHFVRIYNAQGALLHEYGFRVR